MIYSAAEISLIIIIILACIFVSILIATPFIVIAVVKGTKKRNIEAQENNAEDGYTSNTSSTKNENAFIKDMDNDGKIGINDVGSSIAKAFGNMKGIAQAERERAYDERTTVFCTHCGVKNKLGDKYCSSCGAPLNQQ